MDEGDDRGGARHLGLLGATGVGVGAIVGGGILALAGVAFAAAGPSAILAFALNGVIALVTARSFAVLSATFPESGGTYTFAKKVLSVEGAFMVGWVVWFASIVAAVLYALGFAAFTIAMIERLLNATSGPAPAWLGGRVPLAGLAIAATAFYAGSLVRRATGGGQWTTVGKIVVFAIVIAAGAYAFATRTELDASRQLRPFFAGGALGVVQAMGFAFIALQGFDLIAAVGGEVRAPQRNLPRSMYLSLAIALAIYLPLLFLVTTVGVPAGASIREASAADPERIIAVAAEAFMGSTGYWLVIVAAILSMLSALQANLYGASRVALSMARDRTLPGVLGRIRAGRGTPAAAVLTTAVGVVVVLIAIPDVATAGAASSLIFLISFAMAHFASILVSRRSAGRAMAAARRLPLAPTLGAAACLALALFQGFAVPAAGALAAVWLGFGLGLYFALFAPRARVVDSSAQALDPNLVRLRGRSPLVLVPIANPTSAAGLVSAATALVTPGVGRVVVLSVVPPPLEDAKEEDLRPLVDAQSVLGESLRESFAGHLAPETLITISDQPWLEIERVARLHRCESLLLGLGRLDDERIGSRVEDLMGRVAADTVVLRAAPGWHLADARRVLVPLGGRRDHSPLRARLLGSLCRLGERELQFVRVMPTSSDRGLVRRAKRELRRLAEDEAPGAAAVEVVSSDDPGGELVRRASESDLVVLGIRRQGARSKAFGTLPLRLARETATPMILISRRG